MPGRPTFFDPSDRADILRRISSLQADAPRRWGTMNAPRMVAHLTDQMRHCLGEVPVTPHAGPMRLPLVKYVAIYWMPWPKGRIQGPPEAFVTPPGAWEQDLAALRGYVEQFAARNPEGAWPPHLLFGRMTGRDWGVFCYKHFDHHLRQFGA